jgi:hypothetical protein
MEETDAFFYLFPPLSPSYNNISPPSLLHFFSPTHFLFFLLYINWSSTLIHLDLPWIFHQETDTGAWAISLLGCRVCIYTHTWLKSVFLYYFYPLSGRVYLSVFWCQLLRRLYCITHSDVTDNNKTISHCLPTLQQQKMVCTSSSKWNGNTISDRAAHIR